MIIIVVELMHCIGEIVEHWWTYLYFFYSTFAHVTATATTIAFFITLAT